MFVESRKLRTLATTGAYIALAVWMIWSLFPVVWALLTSLKQVVDAFAMPPKWVFTPTLRWYKELWMKRSFPQFLLNSFIISGGTVLVSVPVGAMAAYALSRYRGRVGFALLLTALIFRMFPRILFVLPFYNIGRVTGLYGTRILIIIIMVAVNQPFTIWLLRSFFLDVPISLEESAMVDGCSRFGALWRIVLPVIRPGLIATAIFALFLSYNNFLIPLVLTTTDTQTLPVAISQYGAEDIRYWALSAAGAVSIALPIVLIVALAQRYLVRGLTFGAVKA
jgi:multiple sugar transport system permease protein